MAHTELGGRIAVVTGASAGIGEAIARDLAARGAKVVVNARRADRLAALVSSLGEANAAAVAGDASEPAVVDRMLDVARERFGAGTREADLVVVNAGRGLAGSVVTSDVTQWEQMVRTNVLGAAHLIRAAGRRMLKRTEGKTGHDVLSGGSQDIVIIGSNVGRHISPFSSMYGSTKFAVNSMAEAVRRELGPRGIRVTLIAPGFVTSEFQGVAGYETAWFEEVKQRIGPTLTPEDVARTIGFVVSQPASVHLCDVLIRPTRQDYP
ncbi:MAG: SDR family oxidoreductase [Planctomycetes bacterium]|nr:SDR family oxidoreductase [Planctomycetota bacterium]